MSRNPRKYLETILLVARIIGLVVVYLLRRRGI